MRKGPIAIALFLVAIMIMGAWTFKSGINDGINPYDKQLGDSIAWMITIGFIIIMASLALPTWGRNFLLGTASLIFLIRIMNPLLVDYGIASHGPKLITLVFLIMLALIHFKSSIGTTVGAAVKWTFVAILFGLSLSLALFIFEGVWIFSPNPPKVTWDSHQFPEKKPAARTQTGGQPKKPASTTVTTQRIMVSEPEPTGSQTETVKSVTLGPRGKCSVSQRGKVVTGFNSLPGGCWIEIDNTLRGGGDGAYLSAGEEFSRVTIGCGDEGGTIPSWSYKKTP